MTGQPKSWDHRIRAVTTEDLVHRASYGVTEPPDCSLGRRCPERRKREYAGLPGTFLIGGPATHQGSYRYITGRAGRASTRDLYLCATCAPRFATRHGLELPPAADTTPAGANTLTPADQTRILSDLEAEPRPAAPPPADDVCYPTPEDPWTT